MCKYVQVSNFSNTITNFLVQMRQCFWQR